MLDGSVTGCWTNIVGALLVDTDCTNSAYNGRPFLLGQINPPFIKTILSGSMVDDDPMKSVILSSDNEIWV